MEPTNTIAARATRTTLTREELYEKVWQISAVQLAKQLGVSDVAIAKACKRHEIPKPPLGYWAKKAAGKSVRKPPLPVVIDPSLQQITFTPQSAASRRPRRPPEPGDLNSPPERTLTFWDARIASTFARLEQAEIKWEVSSRLHNPLPEVAATLTAFRDAKPSLMGRRQDSCLVSPDYRAEGSIICVSVGPGSISRAGRLLDTLVKAAKQAGFHLGTHKADYGVRTRPVLEMLDIRRQIRIRELTQRIPHEPTAEELARKKRYTYASIDKWDYTPRGLLRLSICDDDGRHEHRSWTDGRARTVESMVREIVVGLLEEVDSDLQRRAAREEQRRREAEASHRRYLEAERRRKEEAELSALLTEVDKWEQALRIRSFIQARIRESNGCNCTTTNCQFAEWVRRASRLADKLDPTTHTANLLLET
ncbi:MAG: hypothetical protein H6812_06105 [Phycisphaeraceae bacterium]|nr:hypothetical protein [Phycisphaerales bacterium]MCB9842817.1 hypothetical protein [Phycisphaeraceae bacterium]